MRRVLLIFIVTIILLTVIAVPALAASNDSSGTIIQVVVPDTATPAAPKLYPTSVQETYTPNGSRMIVKTYELGYDESPGDIDRGSFDREGWRYALTDVTRDGSTYTASFIGTVISDLPSTTAQPALNNSMHLMLIAAGATLLLGLSLGYFIFRRRKNS